MNYSAFNRDLKSGKFHSAYMFMGKEDFLAESGVNKLIERLLTPEQKELNLRIFYGQEADGLPDTIGGASLFGTGGVTVVKQAQALSGLGLDVVVKYLKNPPSSGNLILWAGDVDRRKAFYKKTKGLIDPINCDKLTERSIAAWMKIKLSELGKKMDEDTLSKLASINWPSLRELSSELEALTTLVGDGEVIQESDVAEMGGGSFAFERWALGDAVGSQNIELAIKIARNLELSKLQPTQIIGDLFRLVRNMWVIRWHVDRRKANEASKAVGLPNFVYQRYLGYANQTSMVALEKCIIRLMEADINIKTGLKPGNLEANILICTIVEYLKADS